MNDEKQIAKALLEAKKLHEASYTCADKPLGEYKRQIETCLIEACKKNGVSTNMWALLNLAIHWWNDAELWCEDILAERTVGWDMEIPKPEAKEIE